MAFQDDPGIAYKETTIQGKHEDRDWVYDPKFRPSGSLAKRHHEYRHRSRKWQKTHSLKEMALRVVVNNLHTTTEETLANFPLPYLWLIYEECVASNLLSFHNWKMFSKLLREDKDCDPDTCHLYSCDVHTPSPWLLYSRGVRLPCSCHLYSCDVQIPSPSYELSYYTRYLTCPGTSIDFLTRLRIKGCCFRSDELLALARLNNLLLLDIDDREAGTEAAAGVTDHLVKGWSETQICFPSLQHLTLKSHSISVRSLGYILKLPSLYVYIVCSPPYQSWAALRRSGATIAREHNWILKNPDEDQPANDLADQPPPSVDGIPVAEIVLGSTYRGPNYRMVEFRRGASSSSNSLRVQSPPTEPPSPRTGKPFPRTNMHARKKRRLQDVLSSFEA